MGLNCSDLRTFYVKIWGSNFFKAKVSSKSLLPVVNFIKMIGTHFLYKRCFGSFFYIHVTRKKLPKQHSYEKFVCINVDEIDTCCCTNLCKVYDSIIRTIEMTYACCRACRASLGSISPTFYVQLLR